ncbi:MAG TPA: glycoside hydrolase family 27 protein, partial [Dongiaceae bacterium]|nr:glycoside hydrolase family 27 protein [Dongiaceae bacterium]
MSVLSRLALLLGVAAWPVAAAGQRGPLAPAPPLGWNSWDAYGTTVREDQVKANADAMARSLARFGYRYVVVDIQWYQPTATSYDYKPGARLSMDAYGRLVPA